MNTLCARWEFSFGTMTGPGRPFVLRVYSRRPPPAKGAELAFHLDRRSCQVIAGALV